MNFLLSDFFSLLVDHRAYAFVRSYHLPVFKHSIAHLNPFIEKLVELDDGTRFVALPLQAQAILLGWSGGKFETRFKKLARKKMRRWHALPFG